MYTNVNYSIFACALLVIEQVAQLMSQVILSTVEMLRNVNIYSEQDIKVVSKDLIARSAKLRAQA